MKLTLVDKTVDSIDTAFGISETRSDELCKMMDDVHRKQTKIKAPEKAYFTERLQSIVDQCETIEEVVFCVITDTRFLVHHKLL